MANFDDLQGAVAQFGANNKVKEIYLSRPKGLKTD